MMSIYPWQLNQWQQLCNAYIKKNLSHALLLNGQIGLGKFEFAKEFAKFLLCTHHHKTDLMTACNNCKQCNLVNKETNADLHILTLEDSQVIKLEQIRNVISSINNTSQFNGFKVVIIYPAEKMNIAAANALLKSLEEPIGDSTIFILVTQQYMQLPATIRSRCQRINFYSPKLPDLKEWLKKQAVDISTDNFDSAYQLSQGAPLALRDYSTDLTQVKLLQTLNSLFVDKSWLISDCVNKLTKLPITDFIYCLQLSLTNLIKVDVKTRKEKLYNLLDDISNQKKALDRGIALNPQLIIEDYLSQIKNIRNEYAD